MKKVISVHKDFTEAVKDEKNDSNKVVKMIEEIKKRIKVIPFISLILLLINFSSYAQTPLPKKAQLKTVNYKYLFYNNATEYPSVKIVIGPLAGYEKEKTHTTVTGSPDLSNKQYYQNKVAIGYVYKKQFVENRNLTFIDYSNRKDEVSGDTVISGKYFIKDGIAYIDGVWKNENSFIEGVFKIANNVNGTGLTANPKNSYKLKIEPVAVSCYNSPACHFKENIASDRKPEYSLKIVYEGRTLETSISTELIDRYGFFSFSYFITNSQQVKLTYEDGSVFTGTVEQIKADNAIYPLEGECRYATGEIFTGTWRNYYHYGIPLNGKWTFADGSVEEGNWIKKYDLTQYEYTKIPKNISPTEKHNRVITLYNTKQEEERQKQMALLEKERQRQLALQEEERQKQLKLQEEERQKQKLLQAVQQRQQYLISKYGNRWGNLIAQREYTPGMTKEMVLEFASDKVYKISRSIRNGKTMEMWKFDKAKMQMAILVESAQLDEEAKQSVAALVLIMEYAQMFGFDIESQFPTLVFTNGILTDVYQE
jgi:hypothetical protein